MLESTESYADLLVHVGRARPEVVVIDAGLATSMQTWAFQQTFPSRYFNLGIAEQNAVSLASGLARRGLVPLVHSFSNFLARRAHDQIAISVAWPGCNVKLIAGSCGLFDARNGPSHTAIDDIAAMSTLPGMRIVEPGDLYQTRALLFDIVDRKGPVYFRLRRHGTPANLTGTLNQGAHQSSALDTSSSSLLNADTEREDASDNQPGAPLILRHPRSVATLAVAGSMLQEALNALQILGRQGIAVDLIHVSVLRPLDPWPIITSAGATGLVVTIENHVPTGGFGDLVAQVVAPRAIHHERIALPEEFLPAGDSQWQLSYCRLDAVSIATRVAAILRGEVSNGQV